jgi:hypothetical protein
MRTLLFISALAVPMLASSLALAKSETQCRVEARQETGEIQGLDFTQALTACMLDSSPRTQVPEVSVVVESPQPDVAFTKSQHLSSGTWVRVSPYRWMLKRD